MLAVAETPAGQEEIVLQLVAGLKLLQFLEDFQHTPAGVLDSGIVNDRTQTYSDWAAQINLPIFTNFSLNYQNGVLPSSVCPCH